MPRKEYQMPPPPRTNHILMLLAIGLVVLGLAAWLAMPLVISVPPIPPHFDPTPIALPLPPEPPAPVAAPAAPLEPAAPVVVPAPPVVAPAPPAHHVHKPVHHAVVVVHHRHVRRHSTHHAAPHAGHGYCRHVRGHWWRCTVWRR